MKKAQKTKKQIQSKDMDVKDDDDLLKQRHIFSNPIFWFALIGLPILLSLIFSILGSDRPEVQYGQRQVIETQPEGQGNAPNTKNRDINRGPRKNTSGQGGRGHGL